MAMELEKLACQSPKCIYWMYAIGLCCTEMVIGGRRRLVLIINAEVICFGVEIVYHCARKEAFAKSQFSCISQPPKLSSYNTDIVLLDCNRRCCEDDEPRSIDSPCTKRTLSCQSFPKRSTSSTDSTPNGIFFQRQYFSLLRNQVQVSGCRCLSRCSYMSR